jgi:hypothetical protein
MSIQWRVRLESGAQGDSAEEAVLTVLEVLVVLAVLVVLGGYMGACPASRG